MAHKVVIVLGSPRRNGNCAAMVEQAAAGARAAGAQVDVISLFGLTIAPCSACDACQTATDAGCTIDDDLTAMLPTLRGADALLIASPVYWFTFAAQTKLFLDRALMSLHGPEGNALSGKPLGLLMTYGDADPVTSGAVNAIRAFQDICRYIEAPIAGMVYGSAFAAGEILQQPELLRQAYELGQKMGRG